MKAYNNTVAEEPARTHTPTLTTDLHNGNGQPRGQPLQHGSPQHTHSQQGSPHGSPAWSPHKSSPQQGSRLQRVRDTTGTPSPGSPSRETSAPRDENPTHRDEQIPRRDERRDEPLPPHLINKIKKEHSSTMPVIDPDGPNTGVYTIFLPWDSVFDTQGLHRLLNGQKPHPSLCMLYQKGKCRAASKCNQVHANTQVVADVRAQGRHDCCLQHGDPPSNDQNFLFSYLLQKGELMVITANKKRIVVPWEMLARTACLDKLLEKKADPTKPLKFFMSYVCRLHQEEKCRYGQDCHHIHVCREFWNQLLEKNPLLSDELNTAIESNKDKSARDNAPDDRTQRHRPSDVDEDGPRFRYYPVTSDFSTQRRKTQQLGQSANRVMEKVNKRSGSYSVAPEALPAGGSDVAMRRRSEPTTLFCGLRGSNPTAFASQDALSGMRWDTALRLDDQRDITDRREDCVWREDGVIRRRDEGFHLGDQPRREDGLHKDDRFRRPHSMPEQPHPVPERPRALPDSHLATRNVRESTAGAAPGPPRNGIRDYSGASPQTALRSFADTVKLTDLEFGVMHPEFDLRSLLHDALRRNDPESTTQASMRMTNPMSPVVPLTPGARSDSPFSCELVDSLLPNARESAEGERRKDVDPAVKKGPEQPPSHTCNIRIESSATSVQVPVGTNSTLADVRRHLQIGTPFVFVVDNDVITQGEETCIRAQKVATRVSVRELS